MIRLHQVRALAVVAVLLATAFPTVGLAQGQPPEVIEWGMANPAVGPSSGPTGDYGDGGCGACDSCGDCAPCGGGCGCNACYSPWTVTVGAVFLRREDNDDVPMFTEFGSPSDVLLSSNEFDFDYRAGVEAGVIYQFNQCYGAEVRYFGVDDWNSQLTFSSTGGVDAASNPALGSSTITNGIVDYDSNLHSLEVNGRYNWCGCVNLFAGYRYLKLDEDVQAQLLNGSANAGVLALHTRNELHGFQIGADAALWCCRGLRIDGRAAVGVYGNAAEQSGYYGGSTNQSTAGQEDHTAFVGELGFYGVYQIHPCLAVRAGYQLLWVDGVAIASDQLSSVSFDNGTSSGINTSGSPFYHGFAVGIVGYLPCCWSRCGGCGDCGTCGW